MPRSIRNRGGATLIATAFRVGRRTNASFVTTMTDPPGEKPACRAPARRRALLASERAVAERAGDRIALGVLSEGRPAVAGRRPLGWQPRKMPRDRREAPRHTITVEIDPKSSSGELSRD